MLESVSVVLIQSLTPTVQIGKLLPLETIFINKPKHLLELRSRGISRSKKRSQFQLEKTDNEFKRGYPVIKSDWIALFPVIPESVQHSVRDSCIFLLVLHKQRQIC